MMMSDELKKECEKYNLTGTVVETLGNAENAFKMLKRIEYNKSDITLLEWLKNNIKEAFENGKDDFECLSDREKFLMLIENEHTRQSESE